MGSIIEKTCPNCHKNFSVEYRLREQKCCSYKCSYEIQRKKKERELICGKCGETYTLSITDYKYKIGDYRKFCSRKCANSKEWSDEHKKKLSDTCKNSEKVKSANKLIGLKLKGIIRNKSGKKKEKISFICLYCGFIKILSNLI